MYWWSEVAKIDGKRLCLLCLAFMTAGMFAFSAEGADVNAPAAAEAVDIDGRSESIGDEFQLSLDSTERLDSGELFRRMMLSVGLVIVMGVVAFYVSKKLLPKLTNLPGKEIKVTETVHLGQRKGLHLVEVGGRKFLLGSTNENIRMLADLSVVDESFSANLAEQMREEQ